MGNQRERGRVSKWKDCNNLRDKMTDENPPYVPWWMRKVRIANTKPSIQTEEQGGASWGSTARMAGQLESEIEIEGERKGGVLSTSISSCSSPAGREGDVSLISKQSQEAPPDWRLSTAHSSSKDSSLLGSVGEKVTTPEEVSYRKEVHGFVPPSAGKL